MWYRIGVVAIVVVLLFAACAKKEQVCPPLTQQEIKALKDSVKAMPLEPVKANEVAVMETNLGTMVFEFFPDKAPQHCAAFKRLVNAGYYTCTKFHRIDVGFVVQGGDILTRDANPANDGGGGPGYTLPAEFNDVPHDKGILSMARSNEPNTAGSQFFICLSRERTAGLDGKYTVFGRLIEGMETLDAIAGVEKVYSDVWKKAVEAKEPVFISNIYMEER